MNTTIETVKDLEELAHFLAELNTKKTSHIGYCGEQELEIYQTLKEDFINEHGEYNFLIARNTLGKIVAAVGIDVDESTGEVWGPFNKTDSIDIQHQLVEQLLTNHPHVQQFYFFINKENKKQCSYMDELNAKNTGEHLVLTVQRENISMVKDFRSTPYENSDFQAFEQLHNESFPETYYDAETIINRLSENCILLILKNELNELQGYAYYEVDLEMGEASLEYIAISPSAQNQGQGTLLLREVLTKMFSYPEISEIQLCVDNGNSQANHVYKKVGFVEKHILISYVLRRSS